MTSKQNTVIWIGLILVALNVVIHLTDIKSVIFGGGSKPAATPAPAPQPTPNPPLAPGPLNQTPPGTQIV